MYPVSSGQVAYIFCCAVRYGLDQVSLAKHTAGGRVIISQTTGALHTFGYLTSRGDFTVVFHRRLCRREKYPLPAHHGYLTGCNGQARIVQNRKIHLFHPEDRMPETTTSVNNDFYDSPDIFKYSTTPVYRLNICAICHPSWKCGSRATTQTGPCSFEQSAGEDFPLLCVHARDRSHREVGPSMLRCRATGSFLRFLANDLHSSLIPRAPQIRHDR